MSSTPPSLVTHLASQIHDLIRLGENHTLTWAAQVDPTYWMQISAHEGNRQYLMLQFILPPHLTLRQTNDIVKQFGGRHIQADRRECLYYYVMRSTSWEELLARADRAAELCAALMHALWGATTVDEVELLGARGPNLPLSAIECGPITRRLLPS